MKKDTVIELKKPEVVAEDPLMEILRHGARGLYCPIVQHAK
jgi:hypothetical protein